MEFISILLKKGLVLDWHYIVEKCLDRGIKKEQVEKNIRFNQGIK